MTVRAHFAIAATLTAAVLAGCGKTDSSSSSGRAVEKGDKSAPKKALTPDVFGKKPAPFGALTKLTLGQPEADARKAAPELFTHADRMGEITDSEFAGVSYVTSIDKQTKKLNRIYVQIQKSDVPLLEKAWGPGIAAKDSIERPRTFWFDPETGWRAYVEEGFGDQMNLDFQRYLPVAQMMGEGPDKLAFAPDGLVGKTLTDLRTEFKDKLIETDQATADKQRADLNKFVGQDLDKEVGKAKPSVHVALLPLEWESYETTVNFFWGDDGKVASAWFQIPFEAYPTAKDEIRAMLDKKWGAPKEGKEFGSTGKPIWIYRDKDPRISIMEDTISHGWEVKYETKPLGSD